jgi:hypothetical protein
MRKRLEAGVRGKITCSAQRLSQLTSTMVQAVVEPSAFQIAGRYLTERRVQILEADETRITSVVIGKSGIYEQTILLKDGSLGTKCTCTVDETPFCRHAIAVLVEYSRWSRPQETRGSSEPTVTVRTEPPHKVQVSDTWEVKLTDAAQFMEWFERAVRAIERNAPLPSTPNPCSGKVASWIEYVRQLEEARQISENTQSTLKAELHACNSELDRVTRHLQIAHEEVKEAQLAAEHLQREVDSYGEWAARLGYLAKEMDCFERRVKNAANDLCKEASELEALGDVLRDLASTLGTSPSSHRETPA